MLRVKSGNFDISTLVIADAILVGSENKVKIIRCKCTPSMKSKVYDVSLVFEYVEDKGEWIFAVSPSLCDCANGQFFCSHLLGLLLILYIFQQKNVRKKNYK